MAINNMGDSLVKAGFPRTADTRPTNTRRNYSQPFGQKQSNNGYNSGVQTESIGWHAPKNYHPIDDAEKVIQHLNKDKNGKIKLTTSQIRKFLTAVNLVRNKVDLYKIHSNNSAVLSDELAVEIRFLKVGLLYQAGKDNSGLVEEFVKTANLQEIIDNIINNLTEFQKFCKYVEALVAYHKFLGGKD